EPRRVLVQQLHQGRAPRGLAPAQLEGRLEAKALQSGRGQPRHVDVLRQPGELREGGYANALQLVDLVIAHAGNQRKMIIGATLRFAEVGVDASLAMRNLQGIRRRTM